MAAKDDLLQDASMKEIINESHLVTYISGEAVSGALILTPSFKRLQNSSSICTPGYGEAPVGIYTEDEGLINMSGEGKTMCNVFGLTVMKTYSAAKKTLLIVFDRNRDFLDAFISIQVAAHISD